MIEFISKEIYKGKYYLEYEDIVSGRGLVHLYNWIVSDKPDAPKDLTAKTIGMQALDESNEFAIKAMLYHYLYYFRAAANLAICLNVQGIFLAGDNQVSNRTFVEKNIDVLYKEFLDHPKFFWLDKIPIFTQTTFMSMNIEGCLNVCRNILK